MDQLEGFPHMYYINLDRRTDRNDHMEKLIAEYKLNATRISAVNGRESMDDLYDQAPPRLTPVEIACSLSHLVAIRQWYLNSDTDTAIICEDDVSFETVSSWKGTWKELMDKLPPYWDCVQLSIIYHPMQEIILNLHSRTTYDFSTACYMVNRRYAAKLMSLYWNEDTKRWRFPTNYMMPFTSEETIYRPGACLSIPLFTFTGTMGSDIQTKDHVDQYHVFSKQLCQMVWKQHTMSDLLALFPYKVLRK